LMITTTTITIATIGFVSTNFLFMKFGCKSQHRSVTTTCIMSLFVVFHVYLYLYYMYILLSINSSFYSYIMVLYCLLGAYWVYWHSNYWVVGSGRSVRRRIRI
jgi:hypothetical protein